MKGTFRHWTIGKKITGGFLLMSALVGPVGSIATVNINRVREEANAITQTGARGRPAPADPDAGAGDDQRAAGRGAVERPRRTSTSTRAWCSRSTPALDQEIRRADRQRQRDAARRARAHQGEHGPVRGRFRGIATAAPGEEGDSRTSPCSTTPSVKAGEIVERPRPADSAERPAARPVVAGPAPRDPGGRLGGARHRPRPVAERQHRPARSPSWRARPNASRPATSRRAST